MRRSTFKRVVAVTLVTLALMIGASGANGQTATADLMQETSTTTSVRFGPYGSLSASSGRGSFRFGVATSATQIEDQNPHTDWYAWTQPEPDGLGRGVPVGDAVGGYTRALEDVNLVDRTNVDSYRFGIEWARIEPQRDQIDYEALRHYSQQIDALRARGIRPMITVSHYTLPTWVDDPRDPDCVNGPSDTNLCGFDHPQGGAMAVQEIAEFASLLACTYGDRVDDWVTLNEPMVYMLFAHGFGVGPAGKSSLNPEKFDSHFVPALRNLINAHVEIYKAIKAERPSASVGLAVSVKKYVPVRDGAVSSDPADQAAAERFRWFFERTFVDSLTTGSFSPHLDGVRTEDHPEWRNSMDWLGLQLYDRTGVTAQVDAPGVQPVPMTDVATCAGPPCMQPIDQSYWNPHMQYEQDPDGIYEVAKRYGSEYPQLPLVVSESGIATNSADRRSAFIIRNLRQIAKLRAEGVDLRGYYYWSLLDNFEWLNGYGPHFGLYRVDRSTMTRTATDTVCVYGHVAAWRRLSSYVLQQYGAPGPLPPEPTVP